MARIRRLVIKVTKPEELDLIKFTQALSRNLGSAGVNLAVLNNYSGVEEAKVSIEGNNLRFERVQDAIRKMGGDIHSVEEIHCGEFRR